MSLEECIELLEDILEGKYSTFDLDDNDLTAMLRHLKEYKSIHDRAVKNIAMQIIGLRS